MSKRLWLTVLWPITFTCLAGWATTDSTTAVGGVVVAPDGLVVPNASVEAVRLPGDNDDLNASQLRWIQADNEGRFRLTLSPGRYEIRAKDEIHGYTDPNFMLSTDPHSDFPVIAVDSRDLSEVKVKLGTKGGILEGELLDKATRSPVEKGKVTIADARRPEVFVEVFADKEGRFQFAVPNKPLQISGSAPGYRAASFEEGVTLAGGEHLKITLELPRR
jgi:hypothetical protein